MADQAWADLVKLIPNVPMSMHCIVYNIALNVVENKAINMPTLRYWVDLG